MTVDEWIAFNTGLLLGLILLVFLGILLREIRKIPSRIRERKPRKEKREKPEKTKEAKDV